MVDMNMPAGRPSKYSPEIAELARSYIQEYEKHDHIMPSHAGMAIVLGVAKSTLYEWAKAEDNEFSNILAECMTHQELILFKNGLNGEFNSNITKLALGKHGYSDRQDVEVVDKTPPTQEKRVSRIADLLGKCQK